LFGPLENYPLGMIDSRTVHDEALVESDYIYPNFESESYQVLYEPTHRWYYVSKQERSEFLLITNYDSHSGRRTHSEDQIGE
jgi:hypothetical protein